MLLDWEAAAGDGDVVIGGEQGDQAEDQAANCLGQTQPVKAGPGALQPWRFWRGLRLGAAPWRAGAGGCCWSQGEG